MRVLPPSFAAARRSQLVRDAQREVESASTLLHDEQGGNKPPRRISRRLQLVLLC